VLHHGDLPSAECRAGQTGQSFAFASITTSARTRHLLSHVYQFMADVADPGARAAADRVALLGPAREHAQPLRQPQECGAGVRHERGIFAGGLGCA
jgi:hypothetical protein